MYIIRFTTQLYISPELYIFTGELPVPLEPVFMSICLMYHAEHHKEEVYLQIIQKHN